MIYRSKDIIAILVFIFLLLQQPLNTFAQKKDNTKGDYMSSSERDGQQDFDFQIGRWKTQLKRLTNPLTGSVGKWVEYEGITVVSKVWGGKANLVELTANSPAGHFQGLNLRVYNPESHQWSLHFVNARNGSMSPASIGKFKNGVGEFFNQEDLNGKMIFVRFIITPLSRDVIRFEQSFSQDGGKFWEVNWIAIDTRIK